MNWTDRMRIRGDFGMLEITATSHVGKVGQEVVVVLEWSAPPAAIGTQWVDLPIPNASALLKGGFKGIDMVMQQRKSRTQ